MARLVSIGLLCLLSNLAFAELSTTKQALPAFHNVGVVPMQVDASRATTVGQEQTIKEIEISFSKAVRESNRFDVLEDELIASLWRSSNDRHILVQDYDLSAFLSLTIAPAEDSYILIARILNPNFDILLQESETVANSSLQSADKESVYAIVKSVVYRLVNRLPVDISISSVQGKYVTLTGGTLQGLAVGDELTLVRPYVHTTNPATHAWSDFETPFVGEVKVIETKKTTAIGEIRKLLKPNDIITGDGARVENSPSRTFFKEEAAPPAPKIQKEAPKLATLPVALPPPPKPKEKEKLEAKAETPLQDSFFAKPFNFFGKYVRRVSEWFSLYIGQEGWYYSGPSPTQSKIRIYLPVNMLGFDVRSRVVGKLQYGYGASISYDNTAHSGGTFVAYDAHARLYWEDRLPIFQDIFRFNWYFGIEPALQGLRVNHEQFGGFDVFELRPFIGANGDWEPAAPYKWSLEYSYVPYDAGTIGYKAKKRAVSSDYGWRTEASLFYAPNPKGVQVGASFSYTNTILKDSAHSRDEFSHYAIKLIVSEQFK